METYVTNGALNLHAATIDGATIVTSATDSDTQLSEAQVEGYITNGGSDLNPTTTLGVQTLLTNPDTRLVKC